MNLAMTRSILITLTLLPGLVLAQFDTGGGTTSSAGRAPVGSLARLVEPIAFRQVGTAVFGGRILDIEVHPNKVNTIYVAAASGGVFKSVNNGTTWTPIFD